MMQVQAPCFNTGSVRVHKSWSPHPRDLLPLLGVFAVEEQLDIFSLPQPQSSNSVMELMEIFPEENAFVSTTTPKLHILLNHHFQL